MLEIAMEGDTMVCRFTGRVDTAASMEMGEQVEAHMAPPPAQVLFDLTGCTFVSSNFIRVCYSALNSVGPTRFRLKGNTPDIGRVLAIAGLSGQILDP